MYCKFQFMSTTIITTCCIVIQFVQILSTDCLCKKQNMNKIAQQQKHQQCVYSTNSFERARSYGFLRKYDSQDFLRSTSTTVPVQVQVPRLRKLSLCGSNSASRQHSREGVQSYTRRGEEFDVNINPHYMLIVDRPSFLTTAIVSLS